MTAIALCDTIMLLSNYLWWIIRSEDTDQRKATYSDQNPEDSDHRREKSESSGQEGMDRSENSDQGMNRSENADQKMIRSEDSDQEMDKSEDADQYISESENSESLKDIDESKNSDQSFSNGKEQSSTYGNNKKKRWAKKRKTKDEIEKIMDQYDSIKKENPRLTIDQIANMLNVPYENLMYWKRKLGRAKNRLGPEQKSELFQKYIEIKQKNRRVSDKNIAKQLDICQDTLYKLKKQFDIFMYSHWNPEEKAELLSRSQELILKNPNYNICKIEEILGVPYSYLQSWRHKIENQNQLPFEEKTIIVRKYRKIMRENPEFENINVAEMLGVSFNNLNKWKCEVESPEDSMKQDQFQALRRTNLYIRNSIFGTELYPKTKDATSTASVDKFQNKNIKRS